MSKPSAPQHAGTGAHTTLRRGAGGAPQTSKAPANGSVRTMPQVKSKSRHSMPSTPTAAQSATRATVRPVIARPNAAPQIFGVQLSSSVVTAGQVVSGSVSTSSNVASVEARIAGYGASASRTGVGSFALAYQVPNLPFFLKGRTYTLQIIARNAAGTSTERDVAITVR